LCSRTHFQRYRGCRVPFSCFALSNLFLTVPRVSGPVFMFCTPRLVLGGTEGVGSCFHVLLSRTHFWRYRGRGVLFYCFSLPDLFSMLPRAPSLVFIFCALRLIFDGTKDVKSHFAGFALADSFSTVLRASGLVFLFCAPRFVIYNIRY
jgi:hypothetical protein